MDENTQRKVIRERYGSIALDYAPGPGCGCTPQGEGLTPLTIGQTIGYGKQELKLAPEEANLGLGCGNPTAMANLREGETVLDLGAGGGLDCFLAARVVGPTGKVIGVDMTPDMVERARRAARAGGYENVEFRLGEIEALPAADSSVDVVISNCVVNLSPARTRVFAEVLRVLRPGGRLLISDPISSLPTPPFLRESTDAIVGCLPVLETEYLEGLEAVGMVDVSIVDERPYRADILAEDATIKSHLADHPEEKDEILGFIASIRSGTIQGFKPSP